MAQDPSDFWMSSRLAGTVGGSLAGLAPCLQQQITAQ